jgi:hypothetical protein
LTLEPSYFNKVTTATGSVDDNAQPSVIDWYQVIYSSVYPKTPLITKPMAMAPIIHPGIEISKILVKDFFNK